MADNYCRPPRVWSPPRGPRRWEDHLRKDERYYRTPTDGRRDERSDRRERDGVLHTSTPQRRGRSRSPTGKLRQPGPAPSLLPANNVPTSTRMNPAGTHRQNPTCQQAFGSGSKDSSRRPLEEPASLTTGPSQIPAVSHRGEGPPPPQSPSWPTASRAQEVNSLHGPPSFLPLFSPPQSQQRSIPPPFTSQTRPPQHPRVGSTRPGPPSDDRFRFNFPPRVPTPRYPSPSRSLARFEPDLYRPEYNARRDGDNHWRKNLPIRPRSPPRRPRAYIQTQRREDQHPHPYGTIRRSSGGFRSVQQNPDPRENPAQEGPRYLENSRQDDIAAPNQRTIDVRTRALPTETNSQSTSGTQNIFSSQRVASQHQEHSLPQADLDKEPHHSPVHPELSKQPVVDLFNLPTHHYKRSNLPIDEIPDDFGKTPEERARIKEGLALLARFEAEKAAMVEKKRQQAEMEQSYAEAVARGEVASLGLSKAAERKLRKSLKKKNKAGKRRQKKEARSAVNASIQGTEDVMELGQIESAMAKHDSNDFDVRGGQSKEHSTRTKEMENEKRGRRTHEPAPEAHKNDALQKRQPSPEPAVNTTTPEKKDDLKRLAEELAREEKLDYIFTPEEAESRRREREKRYRAVFEADRQERIRKGYAVKPYRTLEEVRKEIRERKRLQEEAGKKKKPPQLIPLPSADPRRIPYGEESSRADKPVRPERNNWSKSADRTNAAESDTRPSGEKTVASNTRRVSDVPMDPLEAPDSDTQASKKRKRALEESKASKVRSKRGSENVQQEHQPGETARKSKKQLSKEARAAKKQAERELKRQWQLFELVPNDQDRAFISAQEEKQHPLGLQKAAFTKSPVAANYVFVPRGNMFITKRIKAYTFAANKIFYVVRDGRSSYIGYQCPISIYNRVVEHEVASRSERQRLRMTSKWQKARVRDAAMVLDGMFRKLPPVLNAIIVSRLFDDPHRQTTEPLPEQLRQAAAAHLRSGFNMEAEVARIRADMMTYHGAGAARKNKELMDEAHRQAELARERYCKDKWAEWGAEEGTNHNTTLRFATAETFIKLARERGKGSDLESRGLDTAGDEDGDEAMEEEDEDNGIVPDVDYGTELISDSDSESSFTSSNDETDNRRNSHISSASSSSESESDAPSPQQPARFRLRHRHVLDAVSSDSSSSSSSSESSGDSSSSDPNAARVRHQPVPKRRRIITSISSDDYSSSSSSDSDDENVFSTPHRRALSSLQRRKKEKKKILRIKQEPRNSHDSDDNVLVDEAEETAIEEATSQLAALGSVDREINAMDMGTNADSDGDMPMDMDISDDDFDPSTIPYASASPERKPAVTPPSPTEKRERGERDVKIKMEIKREEDGDVNVDTGGLEEGEVSVGPEGMTRSSAVKVKMEPRLVPIVYISD